MSRVLVLGYGSTLRRDDGLGVLAARALEGRWREPRARVEACAQLLIEHAALLAESGYAVFIDAARDAAPGEVSARPVTAQAPRPSPLTHHLTPGSLLFAARRLYGRCPEAVLVAVGGRDFGPGEELSPPAARALPVAVATAAALVENRLREAAHA